MTNYLRAYYYLSTLNRHQRLNSKQLSKLQDLRLRKIVKYAYEKSPFYHRLLTQAGVTPSDVKTKEDIHKLPIIRKEELAKCPDEVVSKDYQISKLKMMRTSGSTGKPLYVYMSQAEDEYRKAKHLRANIACGLKPWDRWITITSPLHFGETTKLQRLLRFYSVIPVSVFDDVDHQLSRIEALNPDVMDGYSNSILLIAKEIKKKGLKTIKPRFLISGAELISPDSRKFVETVFNAPMYDQYGSVEFERIAWQCREKDEYHIDADSLIVEFVDDDEKKVAPGEKGEIVCTSLYNFSMPFIRYALNDIGVPSPNCDCPCGRTFPLMKVIDGRKTSLISFPDGRALAPFALMLAMWTFRLYDSIDIFRIIQRRIDLLILRIKLKESFRDEQNISSELLSHFRKELNLPMEIKLEIEIVPEIPMDKNGKFRIVSSELSQAI
jgi:phenylacetate-CoA ligase